MPAGSVAGQAGDDVVASVPGVEPRLVLMATLNLVRVAFNAAADLSDSCVLDVHDIDHNPSVVVSTRQYVGGWFPVTTPGKQRSSHLGFVNRSDVEMRWLKDHQGLLVCYRDPRGEKFYGNYTDPQFTPSRIVNRWDISLTFVETFYSEITAT